MKRSILLLFISIFVCCYQLHAVADSVSTAEASFAIRKIYLTGNKTTRSHIVFRELTFAQGDTILTTDLQKRFDRSRQNLLNTSLFNFVTITNAVVDSSKIDVEIKMAERWYLFPIPLFEIGERNFNAWWENKNLARANYGFYIIKENFRGRKEILSLKVRMGYSEQFGFSYTVPYLTKKQTSGVVISSYFNRGHEIIYSTLENRPIFFKNPQSYIRKEFVSKIAYTYRKGLYNTHVVNFGHTEADVSDTIQTLNPTYFLNEEIKIRFLLASYFFKHDYRDSRIYPLKGFYYDFEIAQIGLGVLKKESVNIANFYGSLRKYWKVADRFYLASSIKGKYSNKSIQPYYTQRALGYGEYVRGYEYFVIDGASYGLMKAGIKYQLVKPRIQKIPYLKLEKFDTFHYAFYVELFTDVAYVKNNVSQQYNNLTNTFLYGSGIGIDFVTYYDNVFRMEYSFNKLGQSGIFLHLYAPI